MRNEAGSVNGDAAGRPGYPLGSVDNVLRLLTALYERGSLRVGEAAEALNVAPSTAHRLLAMLRYRDFAVQDRHRRYRPGPALLGLGAAARPPELVIAAHDHLVALARSTRETTHLVVLEGNGVRFLDGVEAEQTLRVGSRIGRLLPAHTTSGGKALLAELSADELLALYPRGLPAARPAAVPDLPALHRELDRVRNRGFALNLEESERGVRAVGCCVRDRARRAVAAVVVAAPTVRCSKRGLLDLAEATLEAARTIGARL